MVSYRNRFFFFYYGASVNRRKLSIRASKVALRFRLEDLRVRVRERFPKKNRKFSLRNLILSETDPTCKSRFFQLQKDIKSPYIYIYIYKQINVTSDTSKLRVLLIAIRAYLTTIDTFLIIERNLPVPLRVSRDTDR